MKKQRKQIAILLASAALIFSSCTKNEIENPPPSPEPEVNLTADIDGQGFSANFKLGYFVDGGIAIQGISNSDESVELFIGNFTGEGNYIVSLVNGVVGGFIPDTNNTDNFYLSTGTNGGGIIVVSEWNEDDSTMTGTFEFEAISIFGQDTISVTSGVFTNIDMTGTAPNDGDADDIEVDIDGELFAPNAIVTARNFNQISITGNTLDFNSSINLIFPDTISVGNHSFNFINQGRYIEGNTVYSANSGVLTISINDLETGRIEGVFSFTGTNTTDPDDTKEFTNGKFTILGE